VGSAWKLTPARPAVQYKKPRLRAVQRPAADVRLAMIARMFTYRPRDLSSVQSSVVRSEPARGESARLESEAAAAAAAVRRAGGSLQAPASLEPVEKP